MTEALLRRVFDVLGAADVGALDDLYTNDYVLELPYAKPTPVRVEGLVAVQTYLTKAFEVFRFTLTITDVQPLADASAVVAEYTSEGKVLATGSRYANTYIGIWRFREGRVSATREFYDPMVAAAALEETA
jgi:ketosteroid isomerase-like protein